MVESDLRYDLLVEESLERGLAEVLLAPSVDCHECLYKPVCESTLCLHLLHDACNDLVVEQRNAHEYGDLSHLHVGNHP